MGYTVEKEKKHAAVGKSGCGKGIFIKSLIGYYSDYKGKIVCDDRELDLLEKEDVAQLSSIIHQDIYLFGETVLDNICSRKDYPEEVVDKVIKENGLDELTAELPEGVFHRAGENGSNPSGGQKQRIAVARALTRSKPILVLDEGMSTTDMQTIYGIESRLLKANDLTLTIITHSLEEKLLKKYDGITYVDNESIKGQGHLQELINASSCSLEYVHLKE